MCRWRCLILSQVEAIRRLIKVPPEHLSCLLFTKLTQISPLTKLEDKYALSEGFKRQTIKFQPNKC